MAEIPEVGVRESLAEFGAAVGAPGIGEDAAHIGEEVGGWAEFVRNDSGSVAGKGFEHDFLDAIGEDVVPKAGFVGEIDDHRGSTEGDIETNGSAVRKISLIPNDSGKA